MITNKRTKDKGSICISVFIPHGQVHRHLGLTPGTPTALWPGSTPGRGWPPAGRRPGSAGGCPDTETHTQNEGDERHHDLQTHAVNKHVA